MKIKQLVFLFAFLAFCGCNNSNAKEQQSNPEYEVKVLEISEIEDYNENQVDSLVVAMGGQKSDVVVANNTLYLNVESILKSKKMSAEDCLLNFYEVYKSEATVSAFLSILDHASSTSTQLYGDYSSISSYVKVSPKDTQAIASLTRKKADLLPQDAMIYWSGSGDSYSFVLVKKTNPAPLDGRCLKEVSVDRNRWGDMFIDLSMDKAGAEKWAKLTEQNIGSRIAMAIGSKVVFAPSVNGQIEGGRSTITNSDDSFIELLKYAIMVKVGSKL